MTYVPLLLSLLIVDLLAAISPGPNFVVVAQAAIRGSFRKGLAVVAGILTANLLWCLGVALGLSALFELAPWLYGTMRLLGAAYLIYLGVTLWRTKNQPMFTPDASFQLGLLAAYVRGLLTNLANPKSVVYFGSIFTLFMGPAIPFLVKVLAIGIVLVDTVVWYGVVAAMFSSVRLQHSYAVLGNPINRITGAVMIGFGTRLLMVRD